MKVKIVLVGGGSASGKTLLCNTISEKLKDQVAIIGVDNYCIGHPELSMEERAKINYDHPTSYDGDELCKDLKTLLEKGEVDIPTYDYALHQRSEKTLHVDLKKYILIDGIFALYYPSLLEIADAKVYVEAMESVRLERRIKRDIEERGRTRESVLEQFKTTVKPMHDKYIEPTKENCDIMFVNNGATGLVDSVVEEVMALFVDED